MICNLWVRVIHKELLNIKTNWSSERTFLHLAPGRGIINKISSSNMEFYSHWWYGIKHYLLHLTVQNILALNSRCIYFRILSASVWLKYILFFKKNQEFLMHYHTETIDWGWWSCIDSWELVHALWVLVTATHLCTCSNVKESIPDGIDKHSWFVIPAM